MWYSSSPSSSTPFCCSTVAPDVGIWNLKNLLVPELMKLEYCSACLPITPHLNHLLPTILNPEQSKTNPQTRNLWRSLHPHPYQNTVSLLLTPKHSNPHTLTSSAAEIKNVVMIAFAYRWWLGEWNRGLRHRRAWGNRRRESGGCWRSNGNGLSIGWQWCDVVFVLIFFFTLSSPYLRPIRVFNFISQSRHADHFPFNGAL